MKLTNRQKSIIWKSLNLNEEFFDDSINIPDENPVYYPDNDPNEYTYHLQFVIYFWPLTDKSPDDSEKNAKYYFEIPEYRHIIESAFLSMKNVLDYILKATSIVTEYSKPKFCTTNSNFITEFPYMNNEPLPALFIGNKLQRQVFYDYTIHRMITLETTFNLSNRKNEDNIQKLLYKFYKLQQIYNNLINKIHNGTQTAPQICFGFFRKKPDAKTDLFQLLSPNDKENRYDSAHTQLLLTDYEQINWILDKIKSNKRSYRRIKSKKL